MKAVYYKFEKLDALVKQEYNIRSNNRLDCTFSTSHISDGRGIDKLLNSKGQLAVYLEKARHPLGMYSLQLPLGGIDSINLSTIMLNCDGCNKGFGAPPKHSEVLSDYRDDAFLFAFTPSYDKVELIVIPEGRSNQKAFYGRYVDGDFDGIIEQMRSQAQPFFNYKRTQLTLL